MSYGPQLPPHLQRQRENEKVDDSQSSDSEEDSGQVIGPRLPAEFCRGPKPDSIMCGPKPGSSSQQAEESSDDDVIGPKPPLPGEEISAQDSIARQLEARARKMRERLEGKESNEPVKRETWMLELPTTLSKNFGLGPRSFSQNSGPKPKQDKSWTRAPNSAGNTAECEGDTNEEVSEDRDVLEYLASLKRDEEMQKIATELREKRGSETLMEKHSKKLKKEKEKDKDKPQERRPFDREVDLQVNRFDDAQRKQMMKKAAQLDNRFSSGAQKFL